MCVTGLVSSVALINLSKAMEWILFGFIVPAGGVCRGGVAQQLTAGMGEDREAKGSRLSHSRQAERHWK